MSILYILLAILFFGFLIFVHELGHFLVARACGVKILEFAIGMGPKIVSVKSKKSGTAYSLRLFPIGGFVSMLGENGMELAQGGSGQDGTSAPPASGADDASDRDGSDDGNRDSFFVNSAAEPAANQPPSPAAATSPVKDPGAYCNQKLWKRMLISLAGPLMNIVLGYVLMVVLVLWAGPASVGGTQIAGFYVEYTAEEALGGIQKGDSIVGVDGADVRSMAQLRELVSAKPSGLFTVTVQRPNEDRTAVIDVTLEHVPLSPELLESSFASSLSEGSGLQVNDIVKKVNNTAVHTFNELFYEMSNQGYRPLTLTVERNGEKVVLENVIIPSYVASGVTFGNPDFQVYREASFDFPTVIKHAFWRSCSAVKMVFDSISGLLTGRYGIEAVSGPIGITEVITDAAKSSGLDVLNLLIVISINLGVMNLLPLPALDGGHILLYIIEAIRRKPLKPEIEGVINFIGLILLLGLAVIIAIKDVIAL